MSILQRFWDKLLGRSAPPLPPPQPLPAGPITPISVMGVSLLDCADALQRIGPLKQDDDSFRDLSRGIEFGVREGRVDWFTLRWNDPFLSRRDGKEARPFRGSFEVAGRSVGFAVTSTESDVIAALGEPYWRDEDEDEVLLFYEYDQAELQIELTRHGAIRVLIATTPPVMADAEQRAAYRVTMPWPPPRR